MIVSEGKFYMDATGRKLGPAKSAPLENCGYDFVLGGYPYTSDGKCGYISGGVRMCPAEYLDLIAEWTDEPQRDGPVLTVTRKEIVPGVYGKVKIVRADDGCDIFVSAMHTDNLHDLTAAIETLTAIKEAME